MRLKLYFPSSLCFSSFLASTRLGKFKVESQLILSFPKPSSSSFLSFPNFLSPQMGFLVSGPDPTRLLRGGPFLPLRARLRTDLRRAGREEGREGKNMVTVGKFASLASLSFFFSLFGYDRNYRVYGTSYIFLSSLFSVKIVARESRKKTRSKNKKIRLNRYYFSPLLFHSRPRKKGARGRAREMNDEARPVSTYVRRSHNVSRRASERTYRFFKVKLGLNNFLADRMRANEEEPERFSRPGAKK